jgi:hypothetical protein
MELNPKAVMIANDRLWKRHPGLQGRQLNMGPEDTAYRREWMENYREAADQTPKPPQPRVLPQPVDEKPQAIVSGEICEPCRDIAKMTHEQKMVRAIEAANLSPEIMEELGDIETLVASMVVVGGILLAIAATGYGAIAEAIAVGLLILGAAMSGAQIGAGINSMIDFYQKTRCDRARAPEDLEDAGRSFGDGIAKMGVGGLNLLLVMVGGRKLQPKGPAAKNPPKPSPKFQPPTNPPQLPPEELPSGIRLFRGKPTAQYPDGYWKIEKFDGQGWQRLDPRTMKPRPHPDTHVPLPKDYSGPYDN